MVGKAFQLEPGLREKFEIVYKTGIVFPGDVQYIDTSEAYLERSLGIALQQLNTTYIDLFMIHAPDIIMVSGGFDELYAAKVGEAPG